MDIMEGFYLALVCCAFGVFALGMALGVIREKAYSRALTNPDPLFLVQLARRLGREIGREDVGRLSDLLLNRAP